MKATGFARRHWKKIGGWVLVGVWGGVLLHRGQDKWSAVSPVESTTRGPAGNVVAPVTGDVEGLAAIQAHQSGVFQLIQTESDPGKLLAALDLRLNAFRRFVEIQSDVSLGRMALKTYFRTLKQISRHDLLERQAPPLLNRYYAGCTSFSDCSFVLMDLAELTDVVPAAVLRTLDLLDVRIRELTGELTKSELVPMSESLPQRALEYRSAVLRIQLEVRAPLQRRFQSGMGPLLGEALDRRIAERMEDVAYQFGKMFPEKKGLLEDTESYFERIGGFVETLKNDLFEQLLAIEGRDPRRETALRDLTVAYLDGLIRSRQQFEAIGLYVERLRQADLGSTSARWLKRVDNGELDPETVALALSQFADFEVVGADRGDWAALFTRLMAKIPEESRPVWTLVQQSLNLRVKEYDRGLRDFLIQSGFDQRPAPWKEPLVDTLLREEKRIAKDSAFFKSLWTQRLRLEADQLRLGEASLPMQNGGKPSKEEMERVLSGIDGVATRWMNLACNAMAFSKSVGPLPRMTRGVQLSLAVKPPVYDEGQFSQTNTCVRGVTRDFEAHVSKRVLENRIDALWRPVYWQIGITIATLPLTILSAGSSNAVTMPVVAAVGRIGAAAAARLVVGRLGTAALTVLLPRLTGAVVGSISFTVVNRLLMSTITLGQVPLWDSTKGFWGNYGKELVFGSVVFYFLPYTALMSQGLMVRLAKYPTVAKNPQVSALTSLGVRTATETAFFVPVTYIDRMIQKISAESSGPVFRGWGDFAGNAGHSLATVLAFRYHELRMRRAAIN